MKKFNMNRRKFLYGAGVAISLPLLDIMESATAFAQAATAAKQFLFMYFPNGTYGRGYNGPPYHTTVDPFDPVGTGTSFALPEILAALAPHKNQLNLFRNLQNNVTLDSTRSFNPHSMGSGGILTAHSVSSNTSAKNGVSLDQVLAKTAGVGVGMRFPSLVINNPSQTNRSQPDAEFWNNISWSSATTPSPSISDPRALFDMLFASGGGVTTAATKQLQYRLSVLDAAKESITRLTASVGAADKIKLDEHFTAIRELEVKLQAVVPAPTCNGGTRPVSAFGGQTELTQWIDIMVDMVVLAMRCDLTRVAVITMDQEGSTRNMSFMGAVGQSHDISHHIENNKTVELKKVNSYYVDRYKRALDLLKGSGANQNLLDTGLAILGTPFSNGNYHNASNLPLVLAGNGNGSLLTGRGNVLANNPQVANLYLRILRMYGNNTAAFGNSSGVLGI